MDADNVDGRAEGDEDHGNDGFKEVELGTHVERPLCVEERDGCVGMERN
jgi:hypothetical protein